MPFQSIISCARETRLTLVRLAFPSAQVVCLLFILQLSCVYVSTRYYQGTCRWILVSTSVDASRSIVGARVVLGMCHESLCFLESAKLQKHHFLRCDGPGLVRGALVDQTAMDVEVFLKSTVRQEAEACTA